VAELAFVLDENVSHPLAGLLRSRGWSADSAKELSRLGLSDVQVLLHAAESGQTVVTHNNEDFRALHEAWVTWRKRWGTEVARTVGRQIDLSSHAGVVIVPAIPVRELAAVIEEFVDIAPPMTNRHFSWTRPGGWHELLVTPAGMR
jgi:hypothetical protein